MNTDIKHSWPENDRGYRRWRLNHAYSPYDVERQLNDFMQWISADLHGLWPSLIAAEHVEVRLSDGYISKDKVPLNKHGVPALSRWHLCIEVDKFSRSAPVVETRWQIALRILRRASRPLAVIPPRVFLYYSVSDRQYNELFKRLFNSGARRKDILRGDGSTY